MAEYKVPVLSVFEWQRPVKDKDLTAPPAASKGDRYIVASTGSGLWTGHSKHIATYTGSAWEFTIPINGWYAYVADESLLYYYNGSSWTVFKGEQGDTGVTGDTGIQGDTGHHGDTGTHGDTGIKGDTGVKGDTGTHGDTGIQGDTGTVISTNVIYVDKSGNDTTGTGTFAKPYLTVGKAVSVAAPTDDIQVGAGVFAENFTISTLVIITGLSKDASIIQGKITVTVGTGTVHLRTISLINTDDYVLDIQGSSDTSEVAISNSNLETTWTTASTATQSDTTSKSCVKISRGILDWDFGNSSTVSSGETTSVTLEHNTSTIWMTGSQKVAVNVFSLNQTISSTDNYQNVEVIFNNNTNVNSSAYFKNGYMKISGVVDDNNYILPFYNFTNSSGKMIVEGNLITLSDSNYGSLAYDYNSDSYVIFSNNTVVPINVTTVHMAGQVGSGTGSINVMQCHYDMATMPVVQGNVDYMITLNNGNVYCSDNLSTRTFTMTTGAGLDKILRSDASGNATWVDRATVKGDTGVQGDTGLGDTGIQGTHGDTGTTGAKGDTGTHGDTGIQGVKGDTGTVGAKGDTGTQGSTGVTGAKGDTGTQGIQGSTGVTGAKGDTGVKGDTGTTGAKGDTGTQGDTGTKGDTGSQNLPVVIKTTTYTALSTDYTIVCNSASNFTVNLPAATGSGKVYLIKNINTGRVTVDANSTNTIDGSLTQSIRQWDSLMIVDYVANAWIII